MEQVGEDVPLFDEYESLLLQFDRVQKEAEQSHIAFLRRFGCLLTEYLQEAIEAIRRKKILLRYLDFAKTGQSVDRDELHASIDEEMKEYYDGLRQMRRQIMVYKEAKQFSARETILAGEAYRRIAKNLHPGINPKTECQEELRNLWKRTRTAYRENDVPELRNLELLVRKALRDQENASGCSEIPDLREKIRNLKAEIRKIVNSEPYTYRYLLEDSEKCAKRERDLCDEIAACRQYQDEKTKLINEAFAKGGAAFRWQIKDGYRS